MLVEEGRKRHSRAEHAASGRLPEGARCAEAEKAGTGGAPLLLHVPSKARDIGSRALLEV